MSIHINQNFLNNSPNVTKEATRVGFGRGLFDLGYQNKNVVALCADLTESMQMDKFKEAFRDRFIQVGIAEQNMASVASGMAAMGGIPFIGSYAMFSPGRNWEQIRTNICYNDQKVIIAGGHAGLSVGPDGGTHQALEDIAIMRVLPNMNVFYPADSLEAYYMAKASIKINGPVYLRLCREKTSILLDYDSFSKSLSEDKIIDDILNLKNIHVYNNNRHDGKTLSIITTGPILEQVIKACVKLDSLYPSLAVNINVYNLNIIKFADSALQDKLEQKIIHILNSSHNILTVEEHQIAGGLGSMISEISSEHIPKHIKKIGVKNRFGQSGTMNELYQEYGLSSEHIIQNIVDMASK